MGVLHPPGNLRVKCLIRWYVCRGCWEGKRKKGSFVQLTKPLNLMLDVGWGPLWGRANCH